MRDMLQVRKSTFDLTMSLLPFFVAQFSLSQTSNQQLFLVQVLVSGSETTGEHRVQIWTPGYLQNGKPRPSISSAPATITYGQNVTVKYSGVSSIDRVVLSRVVGATDSNHMDQRQVVLTGASSPGSVEVTTPPNSNIAPPGQYMLFVLSGGVPSKAQYVSLQLSLSGSIGPITS